jgi:hypothetical protein
MDTSTKANIVLGVFLIITAIISIIALVRSGKKGAQGDAGASGVAGATGVVGNTGNDGSSAGADIGSGVTGQNWSSTFSWSQMVPNIRAPLQPVAGQTQSIYFPTSVNNIMILPEIITYQGKGKQPYLITPSTGNTSFGIQFQEEGQYRISGSFNCIRKLAWIAVGIQMNLQSVNTNVPSSSNIIAMSKPDDTVYGGTIPTVPLYLVQSCSQIMTIGKQLNRNDIYSLTQTAMYVGPIWTENQSASLTIEYLGTPKTHA